MSTLTATHPDRFDWPCGPILYLTIKRGPKAGTTQASCTCEWVRTYGTRTGAERAGRNHLRVANGSES